MRNYTKSFICRNMRSNNSAALCILLRFEGLFDSFERACEGKVARLEGKL